MKRHSKGHMHAQAKRMRKPSKDEKSHKKSKWRLMVAHYTAL
jgi:hypothetical protein